MKALHSINKSLMAVMIFVRSLAGASSAFISAFIVGVGTVCLSVQWFFSGKVAHQGHLIGLENAHIWAASTIFGTIIAIALAMGAMVCAFSGLKKYQIIISSSSAVISFAGVFLTAYQPGEAIVVDAVFCLAVFFYAVLAVVPEIIYDAMSHKLKVEYGPQIDKFVSSMNEQLKEAFDAQMESLGAIDASKARKKAKRAIPKKKEKVGSNPVTVGADGSLGDLFKDLNL